MNRRTIKGDIEKMPISGAYRVAAKALADPALPRPCKKCKWWTKSDGKDSTAREVSSHVGVCGNLRCMNTPLRSELDLECFGFWANEPDGCGSFCGPDFGCVHWEKK